MYFQLSTRVEFALREGNGLSKQFERACGEGLHILAPLRAAGAQRDCPLGRYFVEAVRGLTSVGLDAAFDAIGGANFARSFGCLAPSSLPAGYGAQTIAVGDSTLVSAALGLARLKLWNALSGLFGGRHTAFYSITARRSAYPDNFKADMAILFDLLRDRTIHPVIIDRLPLAAARDVHTRRRRRTRR